MLFLLALSETVAVKPSCGKRVFDNRGGGCAALDCVSPGSKATFLPNPIHKISLLNKLEDTQSIENIQNQLIEALRTVLVKQPTSPDHSPRQRTASYT